MSAQSAFTHTLTLTPLKRKKKKKAKHLHKAKTVMLLSYTHAIDMTSDLLGADLSNVR